MVVGALPWQRRRILEQMESGLWAPPPGLKSCHFQLSPRPSYIAFLSLSYHICTLGLIIDVLHKELGIGESIHVKSWRQAQSCSPSVLAVLIIIVGMCGEQESGPFSPSAERDGPPDGQHITPSLLPSRQWYPEVNHFCKEVPIILVGCKTDLREDKSLVKKLRKNKLEPVTYHRVGKPARVGVPEEGTSGICSSAQPLRGTRHPVGSRCGSGEGSPGGSHGLETASSLKAVPGVLWKGDGVACTSGGSPLHRQGA